MLLLSSNTQRQGVHGPWESPWMAPSCTTEGFLAIVTRLQSQGMARALRLGEVDVELCGCFEKMCEIGVWVLRVLAQLGVYCAGGWAPYWHPWSPPLTEKLCSAPCVCVFFCQPLSHCSLSLSPPLSLSPSCTRCLFTSPFQLSFCSESQSRNLESSPLSCLS